MNSSFCTFPIFERRFAAIENKIHGFNAFEGFQTVDHFFKTFFQSLCSLINLAKLVCKERHIDRDGFASQMKWLFLDDKTSRALLS